MVDTRTGEIFFEGGTELTAENIESLKEAGISATEISKQMGIGRATVYKILNEEVESPQEDVG